MRAIETATTNGRIHLADADESHVLPVRHGPAAGAARLVEAGDPCYHMPFVASVWEPAPEERAAIATGRNIELLLLTTHVPPMAIGVTDEGPTDAPPQRSLEEPSIWTELNVVVSADLVDVITRLEDLTQAHRDAGDEIEPGLDAQLGRLAQVRTNLQHCLEAIAEAQPDDEEPSA